MQGARNALRGLTLLHFACAWTPAPRCDKRRILNVQHAASPSESAETAASSFLSELQGSLGAKRSFIKLTLSSNAAENDADAGSVLDGNPLYRWFS